MSITAPNASYVGTGPAETGQILANVFGGSFGRMICGTAQAVLDGSLTAFDVNWIDGTKTISWTPSVVFVTRIPGAATDATASIVPTSVSVIDTTKFTVNISAAGSNTHKYKIAFMAF